MPLPNGPGTPDGAGAELEKPLVRVEDQLASLGQAMMSNDALALEAAASELHRALASAVDHFRLAARSGGVPAPLRRRLAHASARVAAQRESLARATAALDRAIDVLMPGAASPGYGASGGATRHAHTGSMLA
jgi:hypothetical protein